MATLVTQPLSEDYKSDVSSSSGIIGMTVQQKEWFLAILNCDQLKATNMLKENQDLVNWKTSLHYAAKFGKSALIRLFVGNYGAKVNAQNFGQTPLHLAAIGSHEDAIHLLTSVYMADTCIRDFSGRCPSAYLPENNVGIKLQRYFKNPLKILLEDRKNPLFLLAQSKRDGSNRSRSQSPSNIRLPVDGNGDSNPPFSPQFPWQTGGQAHTESETSVSHLSRIHRLSSRRTRSRESSRDRSRRRLTEMNTVPDAPSDIHHSSIKIRTDHLRRMTSDSLLAQRIYAIAKLRKEHSKPKRNPLTKESNVSEESDGRNPVPNGRNLRQDTSHSNRESISSQDLQTLWASKSFPDLNDPNSSSNSKQTSDNSSPSTQTNESQSFHSTDTDGVDRRCTLTAVNPQTN